MKTKTFIAIFAIEVIFLFGGFVSFISPSYTSGVFQKNIESSQINFQINSISKPYVDCDTDHIDVNYSTSGNCLMLLFGPDGKGPYIAFESNLGGATTKTVALGLCNRDKVTADPGEYRIVAYPIGNDANIHGKMIYDSFKDRVAVRNNLTFVGAQLHIENYEVSVNSANGKVENINITIHNTGDLTAFGDHSRVYLKNSTHQLDNGWEVCARKNVEPGQIVKLIDKVTTGCAYPGLYDLHLDVIDFAEHILLSQDFSSCSLSGTLLPDKIPTPLTGIFSFTDISYPSSILGKTNHLEFSFTQYHKIQVYIRDPSGRGNMLSSYQTSYPKSDSLDFMMQDEDRQEVMPGTWKWAVFTDENDVGYSDICTLLDSGTFIVEGHDTQLGSEFSFNQDDEGWITDISVDARNYGDVYSWALEVLLEFAPVNGGASYYYSYQPDADIPPDASVVSLSSESSVLTITDLPPATYNVTVTVWDLSFEIIATHTYLNIEIEDKGGSGGDHDVSGASFSLILIAMSVGVGFVIHSIKKKTTKF